MVDQMVLQSNGVEAQTADIVKSTEETRAAVVVQLESVSALLDSVADGLAALDAARSARVDGNDAAAAESTAAAETAFGQVRLDEPDSEKSEQ